MTTTLAETALMESVLSDSIEAKQFALNVKGSTGDGGGGAEESPARLAAEKWLEDCVKRSRVQGPFTITCMLTPEMAAVLLERNPSNRKIGPKVEEYTRDIAAGDWLHNGETIVVASTGELNDGQHRCSAVVKAGRAIVTEMTFGVSRDSRRTIDTGVKRTVGGHLAIAGYTEANALAHAARAIVTFNKYGIITRTPDIYATSREIQMWCDAHPDMGEHINLGRAVRKSCHSSVGLFAGLHYIFSQIDRSDADKFFGQLASGEMLRAGQPALQLREFLTKEAASRGRSPEMVIAAHAIKAWNLFRKGKTARALTWRGKGNSDERFPMPE